MIDAAKQTSPAVVTTPTNSSNMVISNIMSLALPQKRGNIKIDKLNSYEEYYYENVYIKSN